MSRVEDDPMATSTTSLHGMGVGALIGVPSVGVAAAASLASSSGETSGSGDPASAVMNEKVQAVAGSIYEEFASLMAQYGEGVVESLMPLVVNVLENLDLAYTESQELEVEVELLKEDNEQLVTQYEREKNLRKGSEARLIELEDHFEGDKKENHVKIDSLTSIVKMFELKAKNSQDQIVRLEEKESDLKKEYHTLHERYTDLFKTHIDYMERTKSMLGAERLEQLQGLGTARSKIPASLALQANAATRSSGPVSFGYSELENHQSQRASLLTPGGESLTRGDSTPQSLKHELRSPAQKSPQRPTDSASGQMGRWLDGISPEGEVTDLEVEEAEDVSQDPSIGPATPSTPMATSGTSQKKSETRTGNNLYQELSFQDAEALGDVDDGADITDNESDHGDLQDPDGYDNVNDNYFGMGKEVENLIAENNELLGTKNALNIVKDDLIAKVDELTGEHEILREEIKSLQNVRSRLENKVQELEDELKKTKEDFEKAGKVGKSDEEENDVPMAQRKRFTRVEMARVLMERNQYKERFMELQEAVRWTEMIRANKTDTPIEKKNQKGIWKFFGSLFSGNERTGDPMGPYVNMKYGGQSGGDDEPSGSALSAMRAKSNAERRARGSDIFDGENISGSSGTANPRRTDERREQYKQVRAHVKKDDGRMQAYGWSLPAKQSSSSATGRDDVQLQSRVSSSGIPVPVPVYCRPLMEKEPGMKIWCAAGVNLSGGRTRDGGDIVGGSVFYSRPPMNEGRKVASNEVEKLDDELNEGKQLVEAAFEADQQLSSHVWICTSTHAISKVTVIDANSPADVLEAFQVCSSHLLCIASVPGAKESDYRVDEDLNRVVVAESEMRVKDEDDSAAQKANEVVDLPPKAGIKPEDVPGGGGIGSISYVTKVNERPQLNSLEEEIEQETQPRLTKETAIELGSKAALNRTMDVFKLQELSEDPDPHATLPFISHHTLNISRDLKGDDPKQTLKIKQSAQSPNQTGSTSERKAGEDVDAVHRRFSSKDAKVKEGVSEVSKDKDIGLNEVEKMSSVLPTMWLGSQSGSVYVHSSVSQWKQCIHSIRLKDSVLCVVHVKGRVLAALADGSIAIFHRGDDGQWDLTNYHLLDLGKPHHSIRCMIQVHNKVWCGYRNKIYVIDPRTMSVEKTMDAHPRKESQVRQMAWVGDGVWVSIRLDSTLRLFHAHTHEHLQDVDIEPYVSKMLGVQSGVYTYSSGFQTYRGTGKLGFSFVRITALLVSNFRLWMGTGNGVIISVPLNPPASMAANAREKPIQDAIKKKSVPGETVRVYTDSQEHVTAESFIPYCNMSQAQLSFHGHRDAVKFFVSVPGHGGLALNPTSSSSPSKGVINPISAKDAMSMLVMSGGEGYIDFRIVDDGSDQDYDSHIMVWQLPVPSEATGAKQEAHSDQITIIGPIKELSPPPVVEEARTVSRAPLDFEIDLEEAFGCDSIVSNSRRDSEPPDETGLDAATYQRWNDQVESLLTNALEAKSLRNIEQYRSMAGIREQSVPPAPSPKEDFTQCIDIKPGMEDGVKPDEPARG